MISESEKKDLIEGGFEYGFEQGIAQGVAQSKADIAKAMLSEGLKASVISKCTGLSPEEIAALEV